MLLTNATLVTWTPTPYVTPHQAIHIKDGVIDAVTASDALQSQQLDTEVIDLDGQLVLPGNICAHTHFYGAFARGLGIHGPPPRDFPQILAQLWWRLDQALDEASVRASAQMMLIDAIRHGTTTLIDHHASPKFIDGSLDVIAEEVTKSGLRAVLCYEVSDRGGQDNSASGHP